MAIAAKMERYRNPWQELKLQYGANKGKAYTGVICTSLLLILLPRIVSPLHHQPFLILQINNSQSQMCPLANNVC